MFGAMKCSPYEVSYYIIIVSLSVQKRLLYVCMIMNVKCRYGRKMSSCEHFFAYHLDLILRSNIWDNEVFLITRFPIASFVILLSIQKWFMHVSMFVNAKCRHGCKISSCEYFYHIIQIQFCVAPSKLPVWYFAAAMVIWNNGCHYVRFPKMTAILITKKPGNE